MNFKIINGDSIVALASLKDNSIDSIVTDPPYGLSFMGKKWDYDVPTVDIWKECLRVLKPGGHLLAFGGTRTYHRLVVAIEDAGFEIRDQIQWIYGQGFPKSQNIGLAIDKQLGVKSVQGEPNPAFRAKQLEHDAQWETAMRPEFKSVAASTEGQKYAGYGTALKPANEPICLARKPLSESNIAKNVLKHGTGGMNIDAGRVETTDDLTARSKYGDSTNTFNASAARRTPIEQPTGRFPSNVILDEDAAAVLDGQAAQSVSRFFYQAKASKSDRGEGNTHPTVKPIKLMEYLIKLVTPEGGTVLDPFMGSGTTGVAALRNGFKFRGVELEENYFYIAQARLEKEGK